jgi:hypothetical protein
MAEFKLLQGAFSTLTNSNPPRVAGQVILATDGVGTAAKARLFYDFSATDRREVSNFDQIADFIINNASILTFIENTINNSDLADAIAAIETELAARISEISSGNAGIVILGTYPTTSRTVTLKLSAVAGNILQIKSDGLYVAAPPAEGSIIAGDNAIEVAKNGDDTQIGLRIDGISNVLGVSLDGVTVTLGLDLDSTTGELVITGIDGIPICTGVNIPLKSVYKHSAVITVTSLSQPQNQTYSVGIGTCEYPAPATALAAGKYIAWVMTAPDGTDNGLYVNVQDLVDVYSAGNGIEINGSNVVSVKVVSGSHLVVGSAGLGIESGYNFVTDAEKTKIANSITLADIPSADDTDAGLSKLYDGFGQNTDGAMTQKAVTDALTIGAWV